MIKRKYFLCLITLVLTNQINSIVFAEEAKDTKVIWSCKKPYSQEKILWLVEWGPKSYIKVFEERIPASYSMDGLEKRWDWGLDNTNHTYNYAITLGPDRTATYYEFTLSKDGSAKASRKYKCEK